MNDAEISKKVESLRAEAQAKIAAVEEAFGKDVDKIVADFHAGQDAVLASHGKVRCPTCDGFGAVQRLDAGYMSRFGLREWDGCKACGGDTERRGRGFQSAP